MALSAVTSETTVGAIKDAAWEKLLDALGDTALSNGAKDQAVLKASADLQHANKAGEMYEQQVGKPA